jgi:ABC-type Fe3+/spermidine/putrescine transport system ATPase subunit
LSFEHAVPTIAVEGNGTLEVFVPKMKSWMQEGREVFLSVRPEKIAISKSPRQGFSNTLTGFVESIVYHGRSTQYNVRLKNDNRIHVFEQNEEHFPQEVIDYDNEVYLHWQKENSVLLEK